MISIIINIEFSSPNSVYRQAWGLRNFIMIALKMWSDFSYSFYWSAHIPENKHCTLFRKMHWLIFYSFMINNFTWFVFLERIVYHMLLSTCPEIYRTVNKEKATNKSAIPYKVTNLLAFGSSCFYPVQDVYFLPKHTYEYMCFFCSSRLYM